jgi:predicted ATPase/DNA-binding winged helix-turn-helix (wHTH) protein
MSPGDAVTEQFLFGPFRFVPARRELTLHGVSLAIGQRAFDILLALVSRPGQLVSKDEIMAEVWPGIVVDDNNLQVHVSALRKALSSAGDQQRYVVTVAGRGYRFVAPITREMVGQQAATAAPNGTVAALAASARHNLPQQLTPLIGREAELERIKAMIAQHRLVTLTGAGGVGKTRLAIEAGGSLLHAYPGGVWLAELARINEHIIAPVLSELFQVGRGEPETTVERLASALAPKHLLLILDNCEHVIAEAARTVEVLIQTCPHLSVLATSRERLAIAGESVMRVPSLPVPAEGAATTAADARRYDAVKLFAERAAALGLGFDLNDGNAPAVASICRRLDGIPLAIELAVPRLSDLSVDTLDRRLDERFRLIKGGNRTALPRQQTLQALIDWSYQLLTDQERLLLARMSVFLGRTSLASVAAIVADAELPAEQLGELLLSLTEKSLVLSDPTGPETRYGLLESTRLYALEKLGNTETLRRRHCEHFAARMAEAATAWETMPTHRWLEQFAADVDNLRAALEWSFAPGGAQALGLRLAGTSHVLWAELGLFVEHRHWVERALAAADRKTPADVTARLLSWQAGEVRAHDDPADYDDAMRAAALFRKLSDKFAEGRMLCRAGTVRLMPDSVEDSEALLRKALALLRPAGTTKSLARCLGALASARLLAGDVREARTMHERAIQIYRELGERLDDRSSA